MCPRIRVKSTGRIPPTAVGGIRRIVQSYPGAHAPLNLSPDAPHALKCSRIVVPRSSPHSAAERGHAGRRGLLFVVALNHKEEILSPRSAEAGGDSCFIAAEAQPH